MNNNDTDIILKNIQKSKNVKWTEGYLKAIRSGYKTALKEGRIKILNRKLVLYKSILENHRYISLTVFPQSLRRIASIHVHAGPSGGRIGGYKTLYRMRLQFFWPKLRDNVKQWVKCCERCVSYNVWRTRKY